jgi:hypothetical protein
MTEMSEKDRRVRKRLRDDFIHYSRMILKIRTKAGEVLPFELNQAQLYLHERLEQQLVVTGRIRALILKGRQQGVSTYIGGRYYWKATHKRGRRVFILTHEQPATDNLFGMVERYHDNCDPICKPRTGAANAKELSFPGLDSDYAVGTAGTKAVGRSQTVQLLHGSEVAFWPNAAAHFAGVVQAVPDLPGTEILLESTANGLSGEFYERWQVAEAGSGDYIAIFIPWFWDPGYRRRVPDGFTLNEAEQEYAGLYGCDVEQMVWARAKRIELKDPLLFMQEYPATAAEAFQSTGHDSFIKAADVLRARKTSHEGHGPLILGADPARFGNDGFALSWRQGRKVSKTETRHDLDVVAGAGWIKQVIDTDNPAKVFVDVGGLGAGTVDILHSWGGVYLAKVVGVNFGSEPITPQVVLEDGSRNAGHRNRRAEMWASSNDWLKDEGGADLPDDDRLQADACGPGYSYDMYQRLQLESKEHMRARGVRSPDAWDATVLTFAEPVFDTSNEAPRERRRPASWQGS